MTCAFHHPYPPSGDGYEPEAIEAFSPESMFYSEEGLSAAERAATNLLYEFYDDYYNSYSDDYWSDYCSELAEAYEADALKSCHQKNCHPPKQNGLSQWSTAYGITETTGLCPTPLELGVKTAEA